MSREATLVAHSANIIKNDVVHGVISMLFQCGSKMKYVYQAETFSTARRILMLPHPRGEQDSIARAFHECSVGLHDLDRSELDENARGRVKRLEELMATAGFSDVTRVGAGVIEARELSLEEKFELSRIVDELAYWFRQKCLSSALDQKRHSN